MFNLKKENNDTVAIIKFQLSELTIVNVKEVKENILSTAASGNFEYVILNLDSIRFIDSSGLGMLIGLLRTLNDSKQKLVLSNMSKPVRALFELMRMHKVFDIFDSVSEAQNSFL